MRNISWVIALALLWASSSACATKGYVDTGIDARIRVVDEQVETLSRSIEDNEEAIGRNTARISEVDQTAGSAGRSAASANEAAQAASAAAAEADAKVVALGEAASRLIYEVVLTDAQGEFPFGAATLPDDAKVRLDTLIGQIPPGPVGVFFEIEGHTDSTGPEELNDRLGLERAVIHSVMCSRGNVRAIARYEYSLTPYGLSSVAPTVSTQMRARCRRSSGLGAGIVPSRAKKSEAKPRLASAIPTTNPPCKLTQTAIKGGRR